MELGVTLVATQENPNPGDLLLSKGDEVQHSDLAKEVAQRLWVSFNFFVGEWFLNLDEGTPWFQHVLGKGVHSRDRQIRSVLSKVILGTEGVRAITRLTYSVDRERRMSVAFQCALEDGSTFQSRDFGDFLIEV